MSERHLGEYASDQCPDKALIDAANAAFGASGEDIYVDDIRGYTRRIDVDALARVAKRAGWPPELTPWHQRPNFVRDGDAFIANHHLVELAHDFAEHEADAITMHVDAEEAEYRERGFRDDRFWHELLLKDGPGHSIVRD